MSDYFNMFEKTEIIEKTINVTTLDFLNVIMLPIIIFCIHLIIEWFCFRKNKKEFKKYFYINLINLAIILLCSLVLVIINFENVFKEMMISSLFNSLGAVICSYIAKFFLILGIVFLFKINSSKEDKWEVIKLNKSIFITSKIFYIILCPLTIIIFLF